MQRGECGMRVVGTMLQGALIGVANTIPGVSGGTLALMMGIYKRLIDAIGHINATLLRKAWDCACLRKGAWAALWRYVVDADLFFLAWLVGGALLAIVATSRLMGWVLVHHPALAFAFFLGLVLASIIFPWRCLTRRSWKEFVSLVVAASLTVGLSLAVPESRRLEKAERKQALATEQAQMSSPQVSLDAGRAGFLFLAAMLAISAMVLPGVSGSFILLLLGAYFDILAAVNDRDLLVLTIFAFGALAGLLVCTRMVGRLLERYFNVTMAFMVGLMLGSLYELWPFKRVTQVGDSMLFLGNRLRGASPSQEWAALIAFGVGLAVVVVFALIAKKGADSDGRLHA